MARKYQRRGPYRGLPSLQPGDRVAQARLVSGFSCFLPKRDDSSHPGGNPIVLRTTSASPRARLLIVAASLLMLSGLFPASVGAVAPSGAPTLLTPTEG